MNQSILSLRNITKHYPGVVALDHVSMDFEKGEVHALLGENGAGKSTLIKVISGAVIPDSGSVIIYGKEFHRLDPALAKKQGVEVIYQEFNLVDSLSVAENICLGERYGKLVDYRRMRDVALEIFKTMGVHVPVDAPVNTLPASQQQLVEIAKAISKKARILIMDEPSAPLSVSEVQKMFDIIRLLKESGVTIIYISHRLDEIFEIADRVSVMRDGHYIQTLITSRTDRNELIRLMVGRELKESYPVKRNAIGESILRLEGLCGNGVKDISLTLHKGEILGLAGLVGAGRTELVRLVFGADRKDAGDIIIRGEKADIRLPSDAIRNGVGLIPEDRKQQGCFLEKSVDWNITIASIKRLSRYLLLDRNKEADTSRRFIDVFAIKTPSGKQLVKNLSGGNQQKVVIAKTIATDSDILIFDEPTRGIDVGAKQEIYALMCALAEQGKAILMITSDMAELLGVSDRIIVLAHGRVAGELQKESFSQIRVLELASAEPERDCHDEQ
jgi:ribose transport system ATP-binding protein